MGTFRPDLIMKASVAYCGVVATKANARQSLIPVVMSGIIAVYALVIAVLIAGDMGPPPGQNYSLFSGFMHLACGLSVGLTGTAAGYAIGKVGDMVRLVSKYHLWSAALKEVGCSFVHAAVEDLRRHGSDSHFRRSLGSLWVCTDRL